MNVTDFSGDLSGSCIQGNAATLRTLTVTLSALLEQLEVDP